MDKDAILMKLFIEKIQGSGSGENIYIYFKHAKYAAPLSLRKLFKYFTFLISENFK